MKKFTKISLILSGLFAIIGVVSFICALGMGMTWNGLKGIVRNGDLTIQRDDSEEYTRIMDNENYIQATKDSHSKLDIKLEAGRINLYYGDVEKIQVKHKGIRNLRSKIEGDTLYISSEENIISSRSKGVVTIIIPKGTVFKEVELNIGAGQADIDELCADKISVEVGAGQISANLVGSEEAYSYSAECGIGEIKIGNSSIGGLGGEKNVTNPGADRQLDIECGVGQIEISFQE